MAGTDRLFRDAPEVEARRRGHGLCCTVYIVVTAGLQHAIQTISAIMSSALPTETAKRLQALLDEQAKTLPGCFLTIVTPTDVLFDGCSGNFDMVNPGRQVSTKDVLWFASTTKLITSVCKP